MARIVFPDITRVEVIDDDGRTYSKWELEDVWAAIQDNGQTLKLYCRRARGLTRQDSPIKPIDLKQFANQIERFANLLAVADEDFGEH